MGKSVLWQENAELAPLTSFAVQARARWLVTVTEESQLADVLARIEADKLPAMVLGGGSNLLFTEDFPGAIIHLQLSGREARAGPGDNGCVLLTAAAGENWHALVTYCLEQGWHGLENLALIPGSVGAAPVQNIGAYGVELADYLVSVRYLDRVSGEVCEIAAQDCQLAYRDSIFKRALRDRAIILSCTLRLSTQADCVVRYPALQQHLEGQEVHPRAVFDAVCEIRRNKLPDPTETGNAGSFFRNPLISHTQYKKLKKQWPLMPGFAVESNGGKKQYKVPAAWLIDQRGWKSRRQGDAGVHERQALVLVNHRRGDDSQEAGSGQDVLLLARNIAEDIERTFDICLEPEVRIWPPDAWPAGQTVREQFDAGSLLQVMSQRPGVYRMLDAKGEVLYVGKASNLKKRVSNYFRGKGLDNKTMALVSHIADIDITVTHSETEALLLEQNLIKKFHPPYNIQLRDDKTYPYIMLTHKDAYPRLAFYRGSRKRDATFFGPYPSAGAVRESLALLQKVFRIRQCEDSYFRNRSRPCLQYQIGRCTAPCVGYISPPDYAQDVQDASLFLQGKSDRLIQVLGKRMDQKAKALEYEQAARLRDRIADLHRIQSQQVISGDGQDADVLAAVMEGAYACVHVMSVRGGRMIGSRNLFPKDKMAGSPAQLLEHFIAQYYLRNSAESGGMIPAEILINPAVSDATMLRQALTAAAGRHVRLSSRVRGHRARWLSLASANAEQAVQSHINNRQTMFQRFELLQSALGVEELPQRIECFDISHTMGESTVASCVVFDHNGPRKSDYRRYNIEGVQGGDDYAAMEQALTRRYVKSSKASSVPTNDEPGLESLAASPDIVLIDGGKGQLGQAIEVLKSSALPEPMLIGIAKGISRRAGQETLFLATEQGIREIVIDPHSPALHLLQQVRDEAHRFAITGHRQRRAKTRRQSPLEQIAGLGPVRRRELLRYFGGQQEILRASEADLARTPGISKKLAAIIYEALHNE